MPYPVVIATAIAYTYDRLYRLTAQQDDWGLSDPVWSPDGEWIIVSVTNADRIWQGACPARRGFHGLNRRSSRRGTCLEAGVIAMKDIA